MQIMIRINDESQKDELQSFLDQCENDHTLMLSINIDEDHKLNIPTSTKEVTLSNE